jgi:MOSC domain-containing protein YiiM
MDAPTTSQIDERGQPGAAGTTDRDAAAATAAGRLEAIWLKRARGGPMDPQPRVVIDAGGLVGNANRSYRRAITIIEREVFDRIRAELSDAVRPEMRRANLMISGIRLEATRDRILAVGPVRIRIGGETRPCELMDEEGHPGLQAALEPGWGGGAFGTVVTPGEIAVGDPVRWIE